MFTELKIILTTDLTQRGYVTYYYDGKRQREYNGKKINLEINPNNCKSYNDRLKQFKKLAFEITKALNSGWTPLQSSPKKDEPTLQKALELIHSTKMNSDLSSTYKRDLAKVLQQFLSFLPAEQLAGRPSTLDPREVERFLNQFNTSATHYMNKRRTLSVFFSELVRTKLISDNPVQLSLRKKQKASLHKIYTQEQLLAILEFLKENYPNLHLCCLLAYGCFLRPHQESRLLCVKHVNEECTKIVLSGSENKSKRIRVVNLPDYVQRALKQRLNSDWHKEINLMSQSTVPFNVSYLNTQWSRAKKKMLKSGLIHKDQTIYSFRHTAAVNVYKKTKDIHILQQLLQHSNMIVTLNYLRGLGEVNNEDLKNALPDL
jgi:integrase